MEDTLNKKFTEKYLNRNLLFEEICNNKSLWKIILKLLLLTLIGGGLLGASLGFYSMDIKQFITSSIKIPLLILLTLIICFPSFYIFNVFLGYKIRLKQILAYIMTGIADLGCLIGCFSPIMAFFILSSKHYFFSQCLVIILCSIGGLFCYLSVCKGVKYHCLKNEINFSKWILNIWVIIFGFVGLQLGWILRPFIGSPYMEFSFFREQGGNIFIHFMEKLL